MPDKSPNDKDGLLELLKKLWLPVMGFIGAVTLAYNFYQLWLGDQKTVTYITAVVALLVLVVVLGRQVWKRLEVKWVDRFADWMDLLLRSTLSGYRWKYLEYLAYQHGNFDVKGLSTQGPYNLELSRIFVDADLTFAHSNADIAKNPLGTSVEVDADRHTIWECLRMRLSTQNFVVLGSPGSGKTTLLKSIVLGLSSNLSRRRIGAPRLLPILLALRDHLVTIQNNPNVSLTELIQNQFAGPQAPLPPEAWLERQLESGHCIIMLDGLDEIGDFTARKMVAKWIDQCMMVYAKNYFIVTSRPHGYASNPLTNVSLLQIAPFSVRQIEQFVHNWYLANEIVSSQKDDPGVREDARRGAIDLIARIRSVNVISQLAVNPLLLTMIATVHRYRSSLPGRRVELYAEICDVFLGKRQEARGIALTLTPEQKITVLQELAYEMMKKNTRAINQSYAYKIITGPLSIISPETTPEAFLQEVENSSGLFIEFEPDMYSFVNISFQEYLAARSVLHSAREGEIISHINEIWWHETIVLYCSQTDATQIINYCLRQLTSATLNLAIQCMREARMTAPDCRNNLYLALQENLDSNDPELRQIALRELGHPPSSTLFSDAIRFFKAAGFDCQILEPEYKSAIRCIPYLPTWESEIWKKRLGSTVFAQVFVNKTLIRDDILELYRAAQSIVGRPVVILVVVNQNLHISGWDEINALRFGNGVYIIPIDDIILQRGLETNREREELETQLNRSIGQQDYYDVRDATADRRNFFGRHELASELVEALNQNRHLALLGLRKMGKSSLLQYLRDLVTFPVSYTDLQNGCLDSRGRLLDTVYLRILDGWHASIRVKIQDFDWSPPKLNSEPSIAFAEATRGLLRQLTEKNKTPRLGIFLDEFDLSLPRLSADINPDADVNPYHLDPESLKSYLLFARTLRGLVEETKQITLLVAGVDPRFNRTNFWDDSAQNPFYRFFRLQYLGPLKIHDCIEMISNIGKQMDLLYADDALSFIGSVSGGHPYLARQLCSLAYKRRGTKQAGEISLLEMQKAADIFISHPDYNDSLEGLWQEVTKSVIWSKSLEVENQQILIYLAKHKNGQMADILSNSKNAHECETSIQELKLRHLLSDASESLTIQFDLFRRWIEKHQIG